MIDIKKHPIWKGNDLWGTIGPWKKGAHLVRFFIARQFAKFFPRSLFVGVTGTVGKTTTIACCKEVLEQKTACLTTQANLDPIFNIPITLLKVRKNIGKVLLEMGVEYPGEMDYYLSLVRPATAIVTRVSYQHSQFLGDQEKIASEKAKLVEELPEDGLAILNWDDPLVREMSKKTKANVIFFGSDPKHCHVWIDKIKIEDFKTRFELNVGVERVEIKSNILGLNQVGSMAATALGVSMNIPLTTIKKGLEQVEPPPHRLQAVHGVNSSIILDDSYNAAPVSVEEALEILNLVSAKKRIVVLGETRELGEFSEQMHRQVARRIYKNKVDAVITAGGDTKYVVDELKKLGFSSQRVHDNLQNPQISAKLSKMLSKGDVVLIKGSRGVRLDEVVKKIMRSS